jgi:hypothetical protein
MKTKNQKHAAQIHAEISQLRKQAYATTNIKELVKLAKREEKLRGVST